MLTRADIESYFLAEKTGGLVLLVLGSLFIAGALNFFLLLKTPFFKGAAGPLLLAGLAFLFVGYTVHQRSDAQRIGRVYALDMNPDQLKREELPRMEQVMKRFTVYRFTEFSLFLLGLSLFIYCQWNFSFAIWKGVGLALAFVALTALLFDHFAEKRGAVYHQKLAGFCKQLQEPDTP